MRIVISGRAAVYPESDVLPSDPAAIPVAVCSNDEVDEARAWTNRVFGQAGFSPNYQRLLARGNAANEGDMLAAGDERAVLDRFRAFRDVGVTDLAVRVVPLGADKTSRLESRQRTLAWLASVCPELRAV